MRRHHQEIKERGAEVVAIGQGWPAMAADFKEKFKIPFTLLVDQERKTYKALELKKGNVMETLGPGVIAKGTVEFFKGHIVAPPPKGTSRTQLGGAIVVGKGGDVLLVHRSDDVTDNLPVEELLAALP